MIRKIFIKLFIKWFLDKNREIMNLTPSEELQLYLMRTPEDTQKLIKSLMTSQTLWYWEAKSDEERWIAKGAAMMLKVIKNTHIAAIEIYDQHDLDLSEEKWKKYRSSHRVN